MKTIFVSSTFKDMHNERDVIQEIVSPAINAIAREYGESVSFCDLRWGIDTSTLDTSEGNKKVLEVCLDEIDRCQPPMIVILGNRYGWIPDKETIKNAIGNKNIELDTFEKSVTALEIEYGALINDSSIKNTLFYFREFNNTPSLDYQSEDDTHLQLLNHLKDKINSLSDNKVKTYHVDYKDNQLVGIEQFANMLIEDLKEILIPEWEKNKNEHPFVKDLTIHRSYRNNKTRGFKAREHLAIQYLEAVEQKGIIFIQGTSGSGKSTLMSMMSLLANFKKDTVSVPIFCGLTTSTSTAPQIMDWMITTLEVLLNRPLPHFNKENKRQYLENLCILASVDFKKKIYFFIDAIDQLRADTIRNELLFLPHVQKNIYFVISCLPEINSQAYETYRIPDIDNFDKEMILDGILKTYNRQLDSQVKQAILQKKNTNNPLYLSLLIQRLIIMRQNDFENIVKFGDGMNAITNYQIQLVQNASNTLDDLCVELLDNAGNRLNMDVVRLVLQYIASSRHGLRIQDLQALVPDFNQLSFAHLVNYMNECFILRSDGCYDFSHKNIRQGYQNTIDSMTTYHQHLFDYFNNLPDGDLLKEKEILYHASEIENYSFITQMCLEKGEQVATEIHMIFTRNSKLYDYIEKHVDISLYHYFIDTIIPLCGDLNSDNYIKQRIYKPMIINLENIKDKESDFFYPLCGMYGVFAVTKNFATPKDTSWYLKQYLNAYKDKDDYDLQLMIAVCQAGLKEDKDFYPYIKMLSKINNKYKNQKELIIKNTIEMMIPLYKIFNYTLHDNAKTHPQPYIDQYKDEFETIILDFKKALNLLKDYFSNKEESLEYKENAVTYHIYYRKYFNDFEMKHYYYNQLLFLDEKQVLQYAKELYEKQYYSLKYKQLLQEYYQTYYQSNAIHIPHFKKHYNLDTKQYLTISKELYNELKTRHSMDCYAKSRLVEYIIHNNHQNLEDCVSYLNLIKDDLHQYNLPDYRVNIELAKLYKLHNQMNLAREYYLLANENSYDESKAHSYATVIDILNNMMYDDVIKIPYNIYYYYYQNAHIDYVNKINPAIPLENQDIDRETNVILSFLSVTFWCDEEQEKELINVLHTNEVNHQTLPDGYNGLNNQQILKKAIVNKDYKTLDVLANRNVIEAYEPLIEYYYTILDITKLKKTIDDYEKQTSDTNRFIKYKKIYDSYYLGLDYYNKKNYTKAYQLLSQVTHQHGDAYILVAKMLYEGLGVKKDHEAAYIYYLNLAKKNDEYLDTLIDITYHLTTSDKIKSVLDLIKNRLNYQQHYQELSKRYETYLNNEAIDTTYNEALKYYEQQSYNVALVLFLKGHRLHDTRASSYLARMYYYGQGVEKNQDKYLELIAEIPDNQRGFIHYIDAMEALKEVDFIKAKELLTLSVEKGYLEAKKYLDHFDFTEAYFTAKHYRSTHLFRKLDPNINLQNYKKASKYYTKDFAEYKSRICQNIASSYLKLECYDFAAYYYKLAFDKKDRYHIYHQLCLIYSKMGEPKYYNYYLLEAKKEGIKVRVDFNAEFAKSREHVKAMDIYEINDKINESIKLNKKEDILKYTRYGAIQGNPSGCYGLATYYRSKKYIKKDIDYSYYQLERIAQPRLFEYTKKYFIAYFKGNPEEFDSWLESIKKDKPEFVEMMRAYLKETDPS